MKKKLLNNKGNDLKLIGISLLLVILTMIVPFIMILCFYVLILIGIILFFFNRRRLKNLLIPIVIYFSFLLILFTVFSLKVRSEKETIQCEVLYKTIDLDGSGLMRYYFEKLRFNKRLFLKSNKKSLNYLYVSRKDFRKCWPNNMNKISDNKSLFITFEIDGLVLQNSYSKAKVIDVDTLHRPSTFVK